MWANVLIGNKDSLILQLIQHLHVTGNYLDYG